MNCSKEVFRSEIVPYLYDRERSAILGYGMCGFLAVGVLLNALNLLIFLRPSNYKLSLNIFLSALSIADSFYLISVLFNYAVPVILGELEPQRRPIAMLRMISYPTLRVCYTTSLWLVVCASFERFLAVWFPLKSGLLQIRRAILLITFVSLGAVLINVPAFQEFVLVPFRPRNSPTTILYRIVPAKDLNVVYHLIERTTLQMALPFLLIGCLNGAICWAMRRARKVRLALGATKVSAQHKEIMIVAYACFDVVCNTLPTIQYIVHQAVGEARYCKQPILYLALRDISVALLALRAASSFVIYYTWGTKFQNDCKMLLCGLVHPHGQESNVHTHRTTFDLTPVFSRFLQHTEGHQSSSIGNLTSSQYNIKSSVETTSEHRKLLDIPN